MLIRIFCFLTFFLIASCKFNDDSNIYVSKEIMISLLVDIHLLEEKISLLEYSNDSSKYLYNVMEKDLFLKYNITEEDYRKSYSYYFFNPKELDEIYDGVIDSLNLYNQSFK